MCRQPRRRLSRVAGYSGRRFGARIRAMGPPDVAHSITPSLHHSMSRGIRPATSPRPGGPAPMPSRDYGDLSRLALITANAAVAARSLNGFAALMLMPKKEPGLMTKKGKPRRTEVKVCPYYCAPRRMKNRPGLLPKKTSAKGRSSGRIRAIGPPDYCV
jgi:hypothetical protein